MTPEHFLRQSLCPVALLGFLASLLKEPNQGLQSSGRDSRPSMEATGTGAQRGTM